MFVPFRLLIASWLLAVILFDSASRAAVVIVIFKLSLLLVLVFCCGCYAPWFPYFSKILPVPSSLGLTEGRSLSNCSIKGFKSPLSLPALYASLSWRALIPCVVFLILELIALYCLTCPLFWWIPFFSLASYFYPPVIVALPPPVDPFFLVWLILSRLTLAKVGTVNFNNALLFV